MSFSKVYLSYPKNLEKLGLSELKEKASLLGFELGNIQVAAGSINLEIQLADLRVLQYYLKIPNRAVLILKEFRCRDLPKLFAQTQKIPWHQYLVGDQFSVKAFASKSRLGHEKRIEESFTKAVEEYFVKQNPKKFKQNFCHQLRINIFDDDCSIGIDLSGEHLHRRTARKQGLAPLRENYAAAVFLSLKNYVTQTPLSLIDPMCGSSSLLTEAISYYEPSPRDFSINHLRGFIFEARPKLKPLRARIIDFALGNDINESCIANSRQNFGKLLPSDLVDVNIETSSKLPWELNQLDVTELSSWDGFQQQLVSHQQRALAEANANGADLADDKQATKPNLVSVICNLPYGERIEFSTDQLLGFIKGLKQMAPDFASLLIAKKHTSLFEKNLKDDFEILSKLDFRNNGIAVSILNIKK